VWTNLAAPDRRNSIPTNGQVPQPKYRVVSICGIGKIVWYVDNDCASASLFCRTLHLGSDRSIRCQANDGRWNGWLKEGFVHSFVVRSQRSSRCRENSRLKVSPQAAASSGQSQIPTRIQVSKDI
jgi:hypothetical protein